MLKILVLACLILMSILAHAAEPMSSAEFRACAELFAKLDRERSELLRLGEKYNAGDRTYTAEELQMRSRVYKSNRAEVSRERSCNKMPSSYDAAMICPESRYDSSWCRGFLDEPEVQQAIKSLKAEEEAFTSCARRAVALDGREAELDRRGRLYETGLSSITYSEIRREEREYNRDSAKFNEECVRNFKVPEEVQRSICSHPAYRSDWCKD